MIIIIVKLIKLSHFLNFTIEILAFHESSNLRFIATIVVSEPKQIFVSVILARTTIDNLILDIKKVGVAVFAIFV